MAAIGASTLELKPPKGKIEFVVDHKERRRGDLKKAARLRHSFAAQIHVGLGLEKEEGLIGEAALACDRLPAFRLQRDTETST